MSGGTEGTEFWRDHISAWRGSGRLRAAYCASHDLSPHRFGYWERRLRAEFQPPERRGSAECEPAAFLPVSVTDPPVAPTVERGGAEAGAVRIEVIVAGMTVRVPADADAADLRRVLLVVRSLA